MKNASLSLLLAILLVSVVINGVALSQNVNNKGSWILIKTNVYLKKPVDDNQWKKSHSGGSGSLTYMEASKAYSGKYRSNGTLSYSQPPSALTPGVETEITVSLKLEYEIPEGEKWWNPGVGGGMYECPMNSDTGKMTNQNAKTLIHLELNKTKTSGSGKAVLNPPEPFNNGKSYYKIVVYFAQGANVDYIYEWKPNADNEINVTEHNKENEEIPPSNNEIITQNNDDENEQNESLIINLYNTSNNNLFTSPGDNSSCQLKVDVDCSNPQKKAGRTVRIEFVNQQSGSFDKTEAVTDAKGNAYFTYTAPDETTLEGKDNIKVEVKAVDLKSGKETYYVPLEIYKRNSKSTFFAEHSIMPQGSQYYNEIKLLINAPPKGSGYRATISTKDIFGLLTASKTNPLGETFIFDDLAPGKEYTLYYHNTGSSTLSAPIEDEITLEIPELGLKQTINISVGMDLAIQSVEKKYKTGTTYPAVPEPLVISVIDNFHPDADLEKLFDDFDIKMRVRITPVNISQSSVMSKYQDEWMSRMLTKFEGFLLGENLVTTSGDAIVTVAKSADGKYIINQTKRESLPYVIMFDRGNFDFKTELIDIEFPENQNNNSDKISFTVDAYRNEMDEVLKTALIPMAKVIFDKLSGGLLSYADVVASTADAIMYKNALEEGKFQDAVIGLFSIYCGRLDKANTFFNTVTKQFEPINKMRKMLIDLCEVATNSLFMAGVYADEYMQNKGGGKNFVEKNMSDNLKYTQLILKGTKNYYYVLMDKSGLNNYSATLISGNKLLPSADKVLNANSTDERIESDDDYVLIPFKNSEEANLTLDFNGNGGFLYRVTKDNIDKFEFPESQSSVKLNISSTRILTPEE